MKTIEKHEIELLLQHDEWPAISIFMPVSRIGDQQDSLRYKNFLTEVEAKVISEGMRATEARSLLESEYDLVKDVEYWKNLGSEGLAIFLSRQSVARYPLQISFKERVTVGRRFHIRPLLPLLFGGQYLVLALSRNKLQLFRGDRYHLREIETPKDTPKSMNEALQFDDPERQLQFHTRTGTTRGERDAMFHGHGAGFDDQNETLIRYFQAIDRSLFPLLEDDDVPVILAGTEELHAVYRNASKSRTILNKGIMGNVSELSTEILHSKAWDIAGEFFAEGEQEAVQTFQDNLGGAKVADELQSVMTAAYDGRVENLFVAENEQLWGEFDPDNRKALVKKQESGQVVDLLDEAVFWTLIKKGTVYVKKRPEMPLDTSICAQLRY
ncbi:MAG: hypothetical protein WBB23_26060 [Desulforhopalus sp.]